MLVATVGGCRSYNAKELNSNIVLQSVAIYCNLQNVALELLNFIVRIVRAISQN
jgi:hypothetical protein